MSETRFIHIPQWEKFQHDKRRKGAPWHMEYGRQLDNDAYLDLSLSARGLLLGLRLMYGRRHPEGVNEGAARNLLASNKSDSKNFRRNLEALNHAGFITLSASKRLAPCGNHAPLDVEVEEETRAVTVLRPPTAQDLEIRQTILRSLEEAS